MCEFYSCFCQIILKVANKNYPHQTDLIAKMIIFSILYRNDHHFTIADMFASGIKYTGTKITEISVQNVLYLSEMKMHFILEQKVHVSKETLVLDLVRLLTSKELPNSN